MATGDLHDDFMCTDENSEENQEANKHHRKLERTLEHRSKFDKMLPTDRNLIYNLRSTVEGHRKKVNSLQEELERSQLESEKNDFLRRAAEERLHKHLISMYASPAVDDELRERLPRANKSCPLLQSSQSIQNMANKTTEQTNLSEGPLIQDSLFTSMTSARSIDFNNGASPYTFASMLQDSDPDGVFMKTSSHSTVPCIPFDHVTSPIRNPLQTSPNSKLSHKTDNFSHSTPLNQNTQFVPVSLDDNPVLKTNSELTSPSLLHLEIKLLKDKVDSLTDSNLKLTEKLATSKNGDETQFIILDKVREIYEAQKTRDEAVISRLHHAYVERDELTKQLHQLQQTMLRNDPEFVMESNGENMQTDSNDNDNLDLTPDAILSKGFQWAKDIEASQKRIKEIRHAEMKAVITERDNALKKCHDMEKHLVQIERNSNVYSLAHTTEETLQNKLEIIRRERDYALMKAHKSEKDLQNIKLFYSLQHSLNKSPSTSPNVFLSSDSQPDEAVTLNYPSTTENNELFTELQRLTGENDRLAEELQQQKISYDEIKTTKKQLESLVSVLRRKLKSRIQDVDAS